MPKIAVRVMIAHSSMRLCQSELNLKLNADYTFICSLDFSPLRDNSIGPTFAVDQATHAIPGVDGAH